MTRIVFESWLKGGCSRPSLTPVTRPRLRQLRQTVLLEQDCRSSKLRPMKNDSHKGVGEGMVGGGKRRLRE